MSGWFADVATAIDFTSLGLSPIALDLGFLQLRWYSLAYIAGILVGWWYLLRLLQAPGAPMARRHEDDLVPWATLGIIMGGRLAYENGRVSCRERVGQYGSLSGVAGFS